MAVSCNDIPGFHGSTDKAQHLHRNQNENYDPLKESNNTGHVDAVFVFRDLQLTFGCLKVSLMDPRPKQKYAT